MRAFDRRRVAGLGLLAAAGLVTTAMLATKARVVPLLPSARAQSAVPLRQVGAIPLPRVSGRIDHLAFDAARTRLFVAALGNDTVEVLDTAALAPVRSIGGLHEPQGLAVVPEAGVAVANGGTGTLQLIDGRTFATRWTVRIGGDADNVRYDAAARRLYVAAEGGLSIVDPASGRVVGRVPIEGHPESFQLEPDGPRVFANLPGPASAPVVVGDRVRQAVVARWSVPECRGNYPMALDADTARLFVGCRRPARVAVLDARSGAVVGTVDAVGDTDDIFFDAARQRVYVIGGEGFVDVLARRGDTLVRADRVATRSGARTGLWVADQRRLYVAVPARAGQPAEVRVFAAP